MDDSGFRQVLFRNEVVAARQSHWIGATVIRPPRFGMGAALAATLIVALVIALLFFGSYTQREHAIGALVPSRGLATIVPPSAGTIERVSVAEGERVARGGEILVISSDQDIGDGGSARVAIAGDLIAKQRQLQNDEKNQRSAAKQQETVLSLQIAALVDRQSELASQISLQEQRAKSAQDILDQWTLASRKGVVTHLQVLQQKDSVLQNQLAVKQLRGQAIELRQQVAELGGKVDAVKASLATSLSEIARSLADISRSMTENAAIHRVVLRSPFDGVVSSLPAHSGESVAAGQAVASIAPADDALVGELWLPGTSMPRLKVGQAVTMRYTAARSGIEGSIHGVVNTIAGSATDAARVKELLGKDVEGARYRITVALAEHSPQVDQFGLRAGMELDADVSVERRRLFEWLLDPLYGRSSGISLDPLNEKRVGVAN